MKKFVYILAAMLLSAAAAGAQDLIVKRDASTVKARILEISPAEVRYKRLSNPDGPTYILPVADIAYIAYPNGERDEFNPLSAPAAESGQTTATPEQAAAAQQQPAGEDGRPQALGPVFIPVQMTEEQQAMVAARNGQATVATSAEPSAPAAEQPAAEPAQEEPAAEQAVAETPVAAPVPVQTPTQTPVQTAAQPATLYRQMPRLGQFYDDNGAAGVVIYLDDSGMHGLMVSLAESRDPLYLPWSTIRNPYPETGATDKSDGEANMAAIERYIADNGLSWDDFPAFNWCRQLGDGWYLPAIDEVLMIGYCYNGCQRVKFDRKAIQDFNAVLTDKGGVKIGKVNYYSSTYMGDGKAATGLMGYEPPYIESMPLHEKYLVRAVRKF